MSAARGRGMRGRVHSCLAAVALAAGTLAGCASDPVREERPDARSVERQVAEYLDGNPYFDVVRAVLVTVEGRSVLELYRGAEPEDTWDTESVTKSILSILVGIALDEGHLETVDQTLGELLPSHAATMEPGLHEITLDQLLRMTGGLHGVYDERRQYADRVPFQMGAADPVGEILDGWEPRLVGDFTYSNASAHLVAAVLREQTGMPVLEYARTRLFEPLGIDTEPAHEPVGLGLPPDTPTDGDWPLPTDRVEAYRDAGFAWPVDRDGTHFGWGMVKLTPSDLVRIGGLMVQGGRWNGHQVVSSAWVKQSTVWREEVTPGDTGGEIGNGYCYLWWQSIADHERAFLAAGYGGQLVEVVPARDLVVVVVSEFDLANATDRDIEPKSLVQLVDLVIAPALRPPGDSS